MIYYKELLDKNTNTKMIFLCDKELYGKKITDGKIVLDINDFYLGKEIEDIEINNDIKSIMAIGHNSINLLIKKGIINSEDKKNIKFINNIPYVFIIFM